MRSKFGILLILLVFPAAASLTAEDIDELAFAADDECLATVRLNSDCSFGALQRSAIAKAENFGPWAPCEVHKGCNDGVSYSKTEGAWMCNDGKKPWWLFPKADCEIAVGCKSAEWQPARFLGIGWGGAWRCSLDGDDHHLWNYSEAKAQELLWVSLASFCTPKAVESWSCGQPCRMVHGMRQAQIIEDRTSGGKALVGLLNGACVLAFEGTIDTQQTIQDIKSAFLWSLDGCSGCKVGVGFLHAYFSIKDQIVRVLDTLGCKQSGLTATGHSLGAAQAILATWDLHRMGYKSIITYTFGQPRIGNEEFVKTFDREVGETVPVYRVVHAKDPVAQLGPIGSWSHVGREVYYPGGLSKGYKLCRQSAESSECSQGQSINFFNGRDHNNYLDTPIATYEGCNDKNR